MNKWILLLFLLFPSISSVAQSACFGPYDWDHTSMFRYKPEYLLLQDSVVALHGYRDHTTRYFYDQQGSLIRSIDSTYLGFDTVDYEIHYNSYGKMDSMILQFGPATASKELFYYDINQNLTNDFYYNHSPLEFNNQWHLSKMITFSYDTSNHLIQEMDSSGYDSNQVATYYTLYQYMYDSDGKLIQKYRESNYSFYLNVSRTTYYYQGSQLDSERVYYCFFPDSIWYLSQRNTYIYNEDSLKESSNFYHYLYPDSINYWYVENIMMSYDNQKRLIDSTSGSIFSYQFDYDTADNVIHVHSEFYDPFVDSCVRDYYMTWQKGDYTGISEMATSTHYRIFPNPTSTTITLSLPSNQNAILSIFNLLGEKVKEEKVSGEQVMLDVSSLPQGLYLVRTENRVVGKFVKE